MSEETTWADRMLEFQSFGKVPRWSRPVELSEKIDGTNAQIIFDEYGRYRVGSRKRYITPKQDNFGFAAWVDEHSEALYDLLGPGRHFGEWWGQGIQRGYGLDHKRFSLFPPFTHGKVDPITWKVPHDGVDVYMVPRIITNYATSPGLAMAEAMLKLRDGGSMALPGWGKPEGVMLWHTASRQLYKRTFEHDEYGKPEDQQA